MNLQNTWLKYGLIYGGISIVLALYSYYISSIGLWTQTLISFLVMIGVMVFASREYKEIHEGVLPYGEALKLNFLVGFVGLFISGIFSLILIQLIDPSIIDTLKDQALESSRVILEKLGTSEEVINDALEKTEEDFQSRFTPGAMFLNILTSAIFVLVVAAIVSIFVKKDQSIG
ncbi:MAG TPA: DUF4199 domain-containing protein [Saprospiraceae bacterium]|nr:DUF4199 domain-containing protein [Saprospiraceae bacterium]